MSGAGGGWEQEQKVIRERYANSEDHSVITTPTTIKIWLRFTRVKQLTVKVHVLSSTYPACTVAAELFSETLPETPLKKLQPLVDKVIAAHRGKQQVVALMDMLEKALSENRLVACTEEIAAVQNMSTDNVRLKLLKVSQKKGSLRIKLTNGKYETTFVVTVPNNYPDEAVAVRFVMGKAHNNFPESFLQFYSRVIDNIAQKLQMGFNPIEKIKKRRGKKSKECGDSGGEQKEEDEDGVGDADDEPTGDENDGAPRITTDYVHHMKKEVAFLKVSSDLREQRDDKNMRRRLVRLNKKETAKHEEEERKERDALEQARVAKFALPTSDIPIPSLDIVVAYLVENLGQLPQLHCQMCRKQVLPNDPARLHALLAEKKKDKDKLVPLRSVCKHWFHKECLKTAIVTPPFIRPCSVCGETVSHPKWSKEVEKLEKAWAMQQARDRELNELSDLMGF